MTVKTNNIQAMVVGTSDVVANRIKTAFRKVSDIDLTAEAVDGVDAVSRLRAHALDVIFIDIGDANTNLKTDMTRLFKVDPDAQIVLVATLTFSNVKNAMEGLVAGAAEFVQAPSRHTPHISETTFNREITDLAKALGRARREKGVRTIAPPVSAHKHDHQPAPTLPKRRPHVPKAIAIASSTGGPQALFTLFTALPRSVNQPIFLTQHMPAGFTTALADHIARRTEWPCSEGKDGSPIQGAHIYVAPGDYHMTVKKDAGGPSITVNQGPEENYCRPSAEPMIRGLIDAYGGENLLLVVLTGMGSDSKDGAKAVMEAGGTVIVQDKETSVVWGMPGAVASAGNCHAVLPLQEIGPMIGQIAAGK